MACPDKECDVRTGLGQAGAEVPADRVGADDKNTYDRGPQLSNRRSALSQIVYGFTRPGYASRTAA